MLIFVPLDMDRHKKSQKVKTNPGFGWASLVVLLGSVLFSSKAILVKLAYQFDVDSISLLTLRMLFALPFYLVIAFVTIQRAKPTTLKDGDWWKLIFLGVAGYYVASVMDFMGLQHISAGMGRLVLYTYPTLVVLISAMVYKEKISLNQILALVITYLGVGMIFARNINGPGEGNVLLGAGLIFLAALTFSVYLVGSGRLLPRLGTWLFTSLAMIAACVAILIHHGVAYQWVLSGFHPHVYLYAFLMAVFATVLPTLLLSEGIRVIGSNNASIIGSAGPISTIVLAYFILNERMGGLQLFGAAIVIIGILFITAYRPNQSKTA